MCGLMCGMRQPGMCGLMCGMRQPAGVQQEGDGGHLRDVGR